MSKGSTSLQPAACWGGGSGSGEEDFGAKLPQPLSPSLEPQTKRAAREGGLQAPATSLGEGAQVTAAPSNRFPGNCWQLQEGNYVTPRLRPSTAQAP